MFMYVRLCVCVGVCGLISIPSNSTNYTSDITLSAPASAAVIDQINEQCGNQANHWNHSVLYSTRAYIEYIHNACEQPSQAKPVLHVNTRTTQQRVFMVIHRHRKFNCFNFHD